MILFTNIFYLLIPLLVVLYISIELNWRRKEKNALIVKEKEHEAYILQTMRESEDARRRISRELHDNTIQTLLVMANQAQELLTDESNNITRPIKESLEWIKQTCLSECQDLRRICLDLRPSILDHLGLVQAFEMVIRKVK